MKLSYWEINTWLSNIDFAVIGSGIVGLSCAIQLRELHPRAKIVVFERGALPLGASTKNAGFACFGSMSEILADLTQHNEAEVLDLLQQRVQGLNQLRTLLGDKAIGYQAWGGYELFLEQDEKRFGECHEKMPKVNALLADVFPQDCFHLRENNFGFKGTNKQLIFNQYEGQIDTGKMMLSLLQLAHQKNILLLNTATLKAYTEQKDRVDLQFDSFETSCANLLIATNAFSSALIDEDVHPNRAQVLITAPLPQLSLKGTFHLEEGYYYFRNIANRILLGGGRNLDVETENTADFKLNAKIQGALDRLLHEVILPGQKVSIEHRWSGVLGLGRKKTSIIKPLSNRVFCGVRLGGMGVAIGSTVGNRLANLTKD